MRILGFSKKWEKLNNPEFTTFRYPRADADKGRDWHVGEGVQIVIHPRSKGREFMGTALITEKEGRSLDLGTDGAVQRITDAEAIADGFGNAVEMHNWMVETYRCNFEPDINKLSLVWLSKVDTRDGFVYHMQEVK